MLLKIVIGAMALFPWSLLLAGVATTLYRRVRQSSPRRFVGEYLPPRSDAPLVLDSAQIVRQLARAKQ